MLDLGQRLKFFREAQGIKQEDVAKVIGVARSTYTNYEKNRSQPELDMICQLARFYQVSIDEFLNESPPEQKFIVSASSSYDLPTSLQFLEMQKDLLQSYKEALQLEREENQKLRADNARLRSDYATALSRLESTLHSARRDDEGTASAAKDLVG